MEEFQSRIESSTSAAEPGWIVERVRYPIAAEVDVVVAGGGPAGMGAAIGAARQGARTMLVEQNGFLGGTATAVQMATWNMAIDHMTGYAREIASELVQRGGAIGGGTTVPFDPEAVKQLALEHLLAEGVRLLLHTNVCAALMENGSVTGIVVENKSGRQAIKSHTVVDCTGDADVAARAGAPYFRGREKDSKMRPMTILIRLAGLDLETMRQYALEHPEEFSRDPNMQMLDMRRGLMRFTGFYGHIKEAHRRGELRKSIHYLRFEGIQVERGTAFLNSVRVYDVDGTSAFDLTKAEISGREQVNELVAFIRKRIPGCGEAYVVDTSSNMGVRETRRIVGGWVLSEEDIVAHRHYDDVVARIWRYHAPGVEMHSPDPVEGSEADPLHRTADRKLIDFEIPYGCLVPAALDGILVGGRSLSTTHAADGYTRGMYCCIVTGQVAGIAAALGSAERIQPRAVPLTALHDALHQQKIDL